MQRHSVDPVSLVFGMLFAAAGGLLLANRFDLLTQVRWLVPLVLIVVALALLGSASWSLGRRDERGDPPRQ
jgi:hypothetical protein